MEKALTLAHKHIADLSRMKDQANMAPVLKAAVAVVVQLKKCARIAAGMLKTTKDCTKPNALTST